MLTTKRYEYLRIERIGFHPAIINHRHMDMAKVTHYAEDILKNGLLEPLIVWERNPGEYFLVGGFHRLAAIREIRTKNPTYFDNIDVRVVTGDPDEIRALNLKLNADRVDTKITDFFDTVIYLNNAAWQKDRIAQFLDRSISWVDDLLRYAPLVTPELRTKLDSGEISWARTKEILQTAYRAPAGTEKEALAEGIKAAAQKIRLVRPITFKNALAGTSERLKEDPKSSLTIKLEDIHALILALQGKECGESEIQRVKKAFPWLLG